MEFKKLEIKQEGSWIKRTLSSQRFKRTMLAISVGAIAGLLITFFTDGKELSAINPKDIWTNVFTGAFFGFFLTNSPCARGRC